MSDLKWLRDLGEGRTKGPWEAKLYGSIWGVYSRAFDPSIRFDLIDNTTDKDARFIAAAGTLWDKLVAVAEAARLIGPCGAFGCDDPSCEFCELHRYLDALQAARKEVE